MMARGVDAKWKTIANELLPVRIYERFDEDNYTHMSLPDVVYSLHLAPSSNATRPLAMKVAIEVVRLTSTSFRTAPSALGVMSAKMCTIANDWPS